MEWKDEQRVFFDKTAASYGVNFEQANPYLDFVLARYIGAISPRKGESILELGASGGRFTSPLLDAGARVCAMDISAKSLDYMREQLRGHSGFDRLEVLEDDVTDPQALGDRRFDALVGAHILHHVGDVGLALKTIRRYLKPGGRVVFLEPNPWNLLWYIQFTVHPGKSWRIERGIFHVWPSRVLRHFRDAGYARASIRCFGFFPPVFLNWVPGTRALESTLERLGPLSRLLTLNLFTAGNPD